MEKKSVIIIEQHQKEPPKVTKLLFTSEDPGVDDFFTFNDYVGECVQNHIEEIQHKFGMCIAFFDEHLDSLIKELESKR